MSEKTPYQIMREKQKDVIEKQHQAALQMATVWKANHERNKRLEDLHIKEENSRQEQRKRAEAHSTQRAQEATRQSYAQSALDDDVPFTPIVIDDTSNKCSSDYSTPAPSSHSVSHSSSHSSCDSGSSSGSDSSSCSSGGCD